MSGTDLTVRLTGLYLSLEYGTHDQALLSFKNLTGHPI